MRAPPLGFETRAVLGSEFERGAVIDRRQIARLLALAAPVEFLRGFITGIKTPLRLQPRRRLVVKRETLGLPDGNIRLDAEPAQIDGDGLDIFLPGA
jgi:hypothetical protein